METTRFGNYVLKEKIASRGMADICRATREGLMGVAREVCIKRIKKEFSVDAAGLLRRVKAGGARVPVDVAAWVVAELRDGLAYAHGKTDDAGRWLEIVHRDVSPHNVMVSFQGDVKLSDFGIAKATSRLHATQGAQVKGKLAYMAPEQAMGTGVDHRADLFAVGVTLYEPLTSRLPFVGATPMDGFGAMLAGRRQPLRALQPETSAPLDGFVDRLLAYSPDQRTANAQEAREALA
jgi:serine/threonine protein kinase